MPKKKAPTPDITEEIPAYPDLKGAMRRLQIRRTEVDATAQGLIDKWLNQLARIQVEMQRLQKIEQLEGALARSGEERKHD